MAETAIPVPQAYQRNESEQAAFDAAVAKPCSLTARAATQFLIKWAQRQGGIPRGTDRQIHEPLAAGSPSLTAAAQPASAVTYP